MGRPLSCGKEGSMVPTQLIRLDVSRSKVSRERVHLGEGDRNGTILEVMVTENGEPFDCTPYTPYVMIPVGNMLYRSVGTSDGQTLTIPIDESRLGNFSGTVGAAYVSLEDENGEIVTSTQRFTVHVARAADENAEPPETYASDLDELYVKAKSIAEAMAEYETGHLSEDDLNDIFSD